MGRGAGFGGADISVCGFAVCGRRLGTDRALSQDGKSRSPPMSVKQQWKSFMRKQTSG
jgi:hypothetical protein